MSNQVTLRKRFQAKTKIHSIDERGYYICEDAEGIGAGVYYLYTDGIIRPSATTGELSAFWPTQESAREFLNDWLSASETLRVIQDLARVLEVEDHEVLDCITGTLIDEEAAGDVFRELHDA